MRFIFIASIVWLISACVTPQKPIDAHSVEQAKQLQSHNNQLNSWVMRAQVSLDTEIEHYSFNALWEQQNEDYLLQFDTLLSSAFMQLKGTANSVELRLQDKMYYGKNPDQLIKQLTPFDIPVTGLKYWIRGVKQPEIPAQQTINFAGEIKTIKQKGWLIEYGNWEQFTINQQRYLLPSDMTLTRKEMILHIQPSAWSRKKQIINPLFSDLE